MDLRIQLLDQQDKKYWVLNDRDAKLTCYN